MRTLPNLAQLRAFVAVVEHGSFGAAGAALGITQSAVSHAVGALERTVGQAVVRRTDPVQPTVLGQQLLPHAQAAVAATTAVADLASQDVGGPTGIVRLGASTTVCQGLLPDLLRRTAEDHPRIQVQVFEGQDDEVKDWLDAGTVDLAVIVGGNRPRTVPIGEDAFQALLHRDHPLTGQAVLDVRDLADDPLLFCLGGCEAQVREVYRLAGTTPVPTHRLRELGTLIAMVGAGIGVAVVPGLVEAMLGPETLLVPLRQRVTRRLVLTGPTGRPWHPAAEALLATTAHLTGSDPSRR